MTGGNGESRAEAARRYPVDEARRVRGLIERDRAEAAKERMRDAATLEVSEGNFIHLDDTVVEPTPEWIGKGDVEGYTPRAPDGTVRSVKTVRRVVTPIVMRLWRAGKLSDDAARACLWYRKVHDKAGLLGRFSSMHLGSTNRTAMSTKGGGIAGHIAMTLEEAAARNAYRAARSSITPFYVRFFEAIVIDDVPLTRAARFAKCRNDRVIFRFRQSCQELVDFCEREKIDVTLGSEIERG